MEVVVYRPSTAGKLDRGRGNPRLTLVQFEASKSRLRRGLAHYDPIRQHREVMRVRSLRPDLIHVFNGDGYIFPALALRMLPAVPMMVTLHDPIAHPGDLTTHDHCTGPDDGGSARRFDSCFRRKSFARIFASGARPAIGFT